jgi:hypothetical protein
VREGQFHEGIAAVAGYHPPARRAAVRGQGAGIINWPQSSFMVNSTEWILYGLVLAGAGLVLIGLSSRRRT